jgi:predicted sugar kinase
LFDEDLEKFGDAVSDIDIRTGTFFKRCREASILKNHLYNIKHMIESALPAQARAMGRLYMACP